MHSPQTVHCQNCKTEFIIEPEDFAFYEKIKVPLPTFCPECRLQRRLAWRNERTLYKRTCDFCGKSIISMYSSDVPFPVYCQPCWWSDGWDPRDSAIAYDPEKPFLAQFFQLKNQLPHQALEGKGNVNSEYTNYTQNSKNVYLSSNIVEGENVSFSRWLLKCKESADCELSTKLENCVGMSRTGFCSNSSYTMIVEYSHDVHFMYDSLNCSDCYGCVNLHHKQYHIFNTPYAKEEYEQKVAELKQLPLEVQRQKVHEFLKTQPMRGYLHYFSNNVTGEEIYYTENCRNCYLANFVRDSAYIFNVTSLSRSNEATHDLFDCSLVSDFAMSYEAIGGTKSYQCNFSVNNESCISSEYCMFCSGSNDLFGCIGLRNKKWCILNKEYDEETYHRLREEIVKNMQSYGEFFGLADSPFAYNESLAQVYFPLTKEQALQKGYTWKDQDVKEYNITIQAKDLPQHIDDVKDSLIQETIGCVHEGTCNEQCIVAFKIIPQELALYRSLNIPLPQLCPNCRQYQMLQERNPLRLSDAVCRCGGPASDNSVYTNTVAHPHGTEPCKNAFKTVFDPQEMIVYCESCYKAEVV